MLCPLAFVSFVFEHLWRVQFSIVFSVVASHTFTKDFVRVLQQSNLQIFSLSLLNYDHPHVLVKRSQYLQCLNFNLKYFGTFLLLPFIGLHEVVYSQLEP